MSSAVMLYLIAGELVLLFCMSFSSSARQQAIRDKYTGGPVVLFVCFLAVLPFWLPLVVWGMMETRGTR